METDPEQPPGIVSVSVPEPTSQEVRTPAIQSDNQWKPLPHGPITRTTESSPKSEATTDEKSEQTSEEHRDAGEGPLMRNNPEVHPEESRFEPSDALIVSCKFN